MQKHRGPIPIKAPPLLPCCTTSAHGLGEGNFRDLFEYLYVDGHWYGTLPKGETFKALFLPDHFDHAFYKEATPGGVRTIWKPERAERILWIGYTLEHPAEVRLVSGSRYNFYTRMADRVAPWYIVVTDCTSRSDAYFVTAYPLPHDRARTSRKQGALL